MPDARLQRMRKTLPADYQFGDAATDFWRVMTSYPMWLRRFDERIAQRVWREMPIFDEWTGDIYAAG